MFAGDAVRSTQDVKKYSLKIGMARQAVTLIIFMFLVCLSCLCSSAMGGGLFYACSDGTMKPGEFDLKKCLNFGISDVKAVVSGDATEQISTDLTETREEAGGLIPSQPVDDEAADPNLAFLDYFSRGNQQISGVGVTASASNAAECARICFNDEENMTNEGEKCQGFVSDDATYCKLYPSIDVGYGNVHSKHKAYRLKEAKEGGGAISQFTISRGSTAYAPSGGPKEYGNRHDVNCNGGGMSSFKFNRSGDQVNNSFACLKSSVFGGVFSKETPHDASGNKKGRNHMYYMDRHDTNCGTHFLSQWKLAQWSRSMRVHYSCTNAQTPDQSQCESRSTEQQITPNAGNVIEWAGFNIQCPANKLLTQWKYQDGVINYTCCPKPR